MVLVVLVGVWVVVEVEIITRMETGPSHLESKFHP